MSRLLARLRSVAPRPRTVAAVSLLVAAALVPAAIALGSAHPTWRGWPFSPPPHTLVGAAPLGGADDQRRVCEWDVEGEGAPADCYHEGGRIAGESYAVAAPLSPGMPTETNADRLAIVYVDRYVGGWGRSVEEPVHRTLNGHPAVEIAEALDDGEVRISTYVFTGVDVIQNSCVVFQGFWDEPMRRECADRLETETEVI